MSLPYFKAGNRVLVPAGTEIWSEGAKSYGSSANAQTVDVTHIQTTWYVARQGHRYQKQALVWTDASGQVRRAMVTKDMKLVQR